VLEGIPSWQGIVNIVDMEAVGSIVVKAHLHAICRIMGLVMIVPMAMGVRVAMRLPVRGMMVRMESMGLVC
jgi:hypothetical protein